MTELLTDAVKQNTIEVNDDKDPVNPDLQAFVDARGHTAIFLLIPNFKESLSWEHAINIRLALEGKQFDDLDLVVHSAGGYIGPAYSIIRMLRSHTKGKIYACIPIMAMSAATLLCLGANEIILDEIGTMGPLDVQVPEEGKNQRISALNPFKSLQELTQQARITVYDLYNDLTSVSDLTKSDCFEIATHFAEAVDSSLLTRLNSEKLGEYRRSLTEGEEYGKRVLCELASWAPDKATEVIKKLVYDYPSHDYVIDCYELKKLGFQASNFSDEEERAAVVNLIKSLIADGTKIGFETTIKIIEPSNSLALEQLQSISPTSAEQN